ncbi:MAG: prepilin-type N-terminal cleavage/methylation domain-containing protein [Thioploca sp.]|nr:prepilin-type N-terminal cleavage/methylation domain-containing protein [Thioploca sp.]
MKNQNAFSLIEVLATLVVAGVLVSVALPNMRNFIMNNRISAKTNELVKAINFARMESISYPNVQFLITPYDGKNWTSGCQIGKDTNSNQILEDSEVIKVFNFKADQVAITNPASLINYASRGRVRMPAGSTSIDFTICNSQDPQRHPNGRKVIIAPTGRVSSENIKCS